MAWTSRHCTDSLVLAFNVDLSSPVPHSTAVMTCLTRIVAELPQSEVIGTALLLNEVSKKSHEIRNEVS